MRKPVFESEIVIHPEYGGFHIDTEMALWLMENRNWKITDNNDEYIKKDSEFDLIGSGDYFFAPKNKEISRTNQDLIDCVKALQKSHKHDTFSEEYYCYICKHLEIQKVKVFLEVYDYHDGKEKVSCDIEIDGVQVYDDDEDE